MSKAPETIPADGTQAIIGFDKMPTSPACGSVIPLRDGRLMWAWSAGSLKPIKPNSDEPPAFSWVHQGATADWQFVASKSGGHFWPVEAPEAILIRSEDVVGYSTAEDALSDGKVSAR